MQFLRTSSADHRSHLGCFQLFAVGSGIGTEDLLLCRCVVRFRRAALSSEEYDEQVESVPKVKLSDVHETEHDAVGVSPSEAPTTQLPVAPSGLE